jgi:hypothetical protein
MNILIALIILQKYWSCKPNVYMYIYIHIHAEEAKKLVHLQNIVQGPRERAEVPQHDVSWTRLMSEVVLEGTDTMHRAGLFINPQEYEGVEISSEEHIAMHPRYAQ